MALCCFQVYLTLSVKVSKPLKMKMSHLMPQQLNLLLEALSHLVGNWTDSYKRSSLQAAAGLYSLFLTIGGFNVQQNSLHFWGAIMHARTSDSQRAIWWTSESAVFLLPAPSTIPQPQDSWRKCTFAGYVCSSMSSNHGNTT